MAERITKILIDLKNYSHNLQIIRGQLGKSTKLMAVVKANAYGHGLEEIAIEAEKSQVDFIGVVSINELRRVRNAGVRTSCLILNYLDPESIDDALELGASVTAMDSQFIDALTKRTADSVKKVGVHLKVDTGMHRAGCEPSEVLELARQIASSPNLEFEGFFTHLAESEAVDTGFTDRQIDIFNSCVDQLVAEGLRPSIIHCANGAAVFAHPRAHFDMVRPGLVTYGLNPFSPDNHEGQAKAKALKPVMSVVSKIVHLRRVASGETVGYGRRWQAERDSLLALVPIGYGDGLRRGAVNSGFVLVRGLRVPIVGVISMDQIVLDVTDVEGDLHGAEVVVLGTQGSESITAVDLAKRYDTINYEVVTGFSQRPARQFVR